MDNCNRCYKELNNICKCFEFNGGICYECHNKQIQQLQEENERLQRIIDKDNEYFNKQTNCEGDKSG